MRFQLTNKPSSRETNNEAQRKMFKRLLRTDYQHEMKSHLTFWSSTCTGISSRALPSDAL